MTMKLWQTHSKLVFGLWDMALVSQTMLYMLGTSIFLLFIPFSSRKERGDVQECQSRACVPGCWRQIFVLSACGNICMETGAFGDGNHPDRSRSIWDAQPEPAHLVYALLIRHVIRVICVFFPFLLSKPVLLLRCPQRLWWGAQFESLRLAWQHLFVVVCVSAIKTLERELRGALWALGIRILGGDGTVLVAHPPPVYCQCL